MSDFAIIREALDMAYDPPSEAHSALSRVETELADLASRLKACETELAEAKRSLEGRPILADEVKYQAGLRQAAEARVKELEAERDGFTLQMTPEAMLKDRAEMAEAALADMTAQRDEAEMLLGKTLNKDAVDALRRAEAAEAERDTLRDLLEEWVVADPNGNWGDFEERVRAALKAGS